MKLKCLFTGHDWKVTGRVYFDVLRFSFFTVICKKCFLKKEIRCDTNTSLETFKEIYEKDK